MRYRVDYQQSHDIDWVGRKGKHPIHVASNGGIIPNNIDSKQNRELLSCVNTLENFLSEDDIVVNRDGIRRWLSYVYNQLPVPTQKRDNVQLFEITDEVINRYASSFVKMAKRGFISMDRYDYAHFDNSECLLIAYPKLTKKVYRYWKEHEELYQRLPQSNVRVIDNVLIK